MNQDRHWQRKLMEWYRNERRDLPWRHTHDPYRIWISEIMLQQTRVDTVIDYYRRFLERFPTVEALAASPVDEVLKYWEGLGYYSRARNLYKAAGQICAKGHFPDQQEEIRELCGIGDYTSGSIASIAFNHPAAAVDGNVLRVISRLYLLWDDISSPGSKKKISQIVLDHMPEDDPSLEGEERFDQGPNAFTQSMMELGALICLPGSPRCEICPLKEDCAAFREGKTQDIPVKKKKEAPKQEIHVLAVIERENPETGKKEYLMHRRPEDGLLKGLWEYPGVVLTGEKSEERKTPEGETVEVKSGEKSSVEDKIRENKIREDENVNHETDQEYMQACLQKELLEQYGLETEIGAFFMASQHVFSHRHWIMYVFKGRLHQGTFLFGEGEEGWFWENPGNDSPIMIPTAFQKIRKKLRNDT